MSELYVKYRPKNTDGILGNELAIKSLKSEIEAGHHVFLITGPSGTGKAQPVDTIIPTPTGYRKFGELKTGDYVYGRNGKPVKVIGVFDRGNLDAYEVELADGRKTVCNDDHLWSVFTSRGNLVTRSLRQLIDSGIEKKTESRTSIHRFAIPVNEAVEFNSVDELPIDPYVMGSFLGNGCNLEKYVTLSGDDEFNLSECARLMNMNYKKRSDYNYSWDFRNKDGSAVKNTDFFGEFSGKLCVPSHEKRIPDVYKYASIENRYKLLQGLFDTDGSISKPYRCNVSYCTTSEGLKDDIVEVLNSLGICSTVGIDDREKNVHKCYNIHVKISNDKKYLLFRSPKKKSRLDGNTHKTRKCYNKIQIVAVRNLNKKVPMRCIKVDAEDELYLTNDYIVTHNTTIARAVANELGANDLTIHEINVSDDRGIQLARQIKEEIRYKPLSGKSVYILDEIHNSTRDFQEAILKILEDCPEWCLFFLATTNPEKLLETIKTRCSRITMKPLDHNTMFGLLRKVAHREQVTVSIDVLHKIADLSEGSSRKGLKLLGQVLYLGTDDERMKYLEENSFSDDNQDIIELCRALINKQGWGKYAECIEKAKEDVKTNPEGVKFLIMSYARTALSKCGDNVNIRAAAMIKAFCDVDTWRNKEYAIWEGLINFCELTGD